MRQVDEFSNNMPPSFASGIGITTFVIAPGMKARIESFLACVAVRSGLLTSDFTFKAKCDHLQEKMNCYRVENGQLKALILEKDAGDESTCTCLLDMEKKGLYSKQRKNI